MKGLIPILILGFLNSSLSAPQSSPSDLRNGPSLVKAKILKQINKINEDGSYTFGYEADDGSFKVETRSKDGEVKGKYGFIDPSGKLKTVEYSAGRRAPQELRASGTETEPQAVKVKVRESRENSGGPSDEGSSKENNDSGRTSSETSSEDDDDTAYNSFNPPQPGQKDGGETSELTKRQGQLGGGPNDGSGPIGGGQYPGQGQRFQGASPYIPTTQLPGGQFRGQFVDPRGQGAGFSGIPQQQPQFYQGGPGGAQPQYLSGGRGGPQQYPIGGFGLGGPQTHYVGRQYPQYLGGSPQFGGGGIQTTAGGLPPQSQQNQIQSQDEDGFVSGLPPNYYGGAGSQGARPQFPYNPQSQGLGFGRPGFQQSPYQQQFPSGAVGGQQLGSPQFSRFPTSGLNSGSPQTFGRGNGNSQQEYVPNAELDGFSEDSDQDGFVDPYPGTEGSKEEAADEKSPAVKTPSGERIQGQYSPQVLGPQQVLQGQGRPGFSSAGSPYSEQELQQIYAQQQGLGLGRPQSPFPQQFSRFPFQGQQPQFQSYPIQQQQFSPQQVQFGGGPQQGLGGNAYIPGQGQFGGPAYPGGPYQGGSQFSQFPIQGQQQFLQGQLGPGQPQYSQAGGPPQYLNIQGGGGPGGAQQFPYDYVGGVGPNGFPLGGPQTPYQQQQLQLQQQQQQQSAQGPSPGGPSSSASPGSSGSVPAATSDSKKDSN